MLWLPSFRWSVLFSNIEIGGEGVRGGAIAVAPCAEHVLTSCYDDHGRNTSKCCLIDTVNSTQIHCVPGKREKGRETLAIVQLVFCVVFVCTTSTYITLDVFIVLFDGLPMCPQGSREEERYMTRCISL